MDPEARRDVQEALDAIEAALDKLEGHLATLSPVQNREIHQIFAAQFAQIESARAALRRLLAGGAPPAG
jgi:DNA-directed RNA polymerase subunit F